MRSTGAPFPVHDIADFLAQYEPFAGVDAEALGRIARGVEIEFFAHGEVIFEQGQQPAERVRIVRRGAVELVDAGRALDLLGEGELFGHPSMLAGLPTGFEARAQEDTICYRLPEDVLVGLLARPEGLRFVARSLLARRWRPDATGERGLDPGRVDVSRFVREPAVISAPGTSVRDVAREMAGKGASCALVRLGDHGFGILTDQDLRVRVVGGEIALDAPVERAMTAPAFTVGPARLGVDVMVEMIDRGIRHVPVVTAQREVLGVVTDVDLLASETRTPFVLRRAIARAADVDALVAAAGRLPPTLTALLGADVAASHICAIISAVADALTRRAIDLVTARHPGLPEFTWYAAGSLGRREAFPSSDVDCALSWEGDVGQRDRLRRFAGDVLALLARCGFAPDPHSATAAHPLFARSDAMWRTAIERWVQHPEDPRLLVVLSVIDDARQVRGAGLQDPFGALVHAREHPTLLRQLRRLALSHRPPTGFVRDIVVEHSGEHRGRLDIKQGGLLPVVDLARYFNFATGGGQGTTPDRLRAAADHGMLAASDATTLEEAFILFTDLRMDHQVGQLQRGEPPDDFVAPSELNPLLRRYLREAFRSIARMQRRLARTS